MAQSLEEYLEFYKKKWEKEIRHNDDRSSMGRGTRKGRLVSPRCDLISDYQKMKLERQVEPDHGRQDKTTC